ncbi:hypothetical protein AWZ03_001549 [Drosophila navojoa]|uniref:Uncharacterized protein n=1 Tax=Drosophila navojoa TaxID=7232 RepID=A0A484BSV3_DRONA|nr:hypothetical protein AWZ03_001549 [Drosophila navojoa]
MLQLATLAAWDTVADGFKVQFSHCRRFELFGRVKRTKLKLLDTTQCNCGPARILGSFRCPHRAGRCSLARRALWPKITRWTATTARGTQSKEDILQAKGTVLGAGKYNKQWQRREARTKVNEN